MSAPQAPTPIERGWQMAEAMLAGAAHPAILVAHWFDVPGDDAVNVDAHFGSDARTLRFLEVVVPTLVDQLAAAAAIVVLPWGLETAASLTVVALAPGVPGTAECRALTRLGDGPGPPFWTLERDGQPVPEPLARTASGLRLPRR